jgi:hypothetical protein
VAGGRAALTALEQHDYDVLKSTPKPRKKTIVTGLVMAYLRGR